MREQSSKSTGRKCRSTTTCGRSRRKATTASISSAAASHAKTLASQEKGLGSQARGPVFGTSLLGSFAQFSPDGWLLKTSQPSLLEGSEPYSETWPKSGLMRNGTAYRLQPLVRRTDGNESGLWPTPKASAAGPDFAKATRSKTGISLATAAAMWPTPTARGFDIADVPALLARRQRCKEKNKNGNGFGLTLNQAVKVAMYPTPTVQDASNNGGPSQYQRNSLPLNAVAGGSLNPTWVEWLMGFPLGWTALDALETPSSRKSSKSSGGRSLQRKRG